MYMCVRVCTCAHTGRAIKLKMRVAKHIATCTQSKHTQWVSNNGNKLLCTHYTALKDGLIQAKMQTVLRQQVCGGDYKMKGLYIRQ